MKQIILIILMVLSIRGLSQSRYLKSKLTQQESRNFINGTTNNSLLKTLDQQTTTLNSFHGKMLVVDFWFTKCYPCFREFPYMEKMKTVFKEDTLLLFINICSESSEEDWRQVVAEKSLTGLNLYDANPEDKEIRTIGSPRPTGRGIVHDQLYLSGYPAYAFFSSDGRLLGATSVTPSDSILFSFYIEGLLNNKSIEESLQLFKSELKKKETSEAFNSFLEKRFNITGDNRKRILQLYKKYL